MYEDNYGPIVRIPETELAGVWNGYVVHRDFDTRDRLIDHYKDMVYRAAERMVQSLPRHVDVMDLILPGMMGLTKAIERFDPGLGHQFSTFASQRVRGEILDELRRVDPVPRSIRQQAGRIESARGELEARLGRHPGDDELAAHLGVSEEELSAQLVDARVPSVMSIDRKWNEDDDHELEPAEMLHDRRAADPLAEILRKDLKEEAMRSLNAVEKQVLVMYYYDHMNMKEIGLAINKSESRVCQIHGQLIEALRSRAQAFRDGESVDA